MRIHWKVLPQGYKLWKEILHSLGKHFKLSVLPPVLWKCEHSQGKVWGWGDLEKYKYFQLNIPTSFSAPRLTVHWAKLNRKERGVVLSRRPQGKRVTCANSSTDHEGPRGTGYLTDQTCTNQIPTASNKKYPPGQCSQSTGQGSCSAHGACDATPRASSHLLSWKLATESCCQDVLGNLDSPWHTAFNILGASTSFPELASPGISQATPIFK